VAIFGGDHIYKFDVDQMEAQHRERDADLTIAAFPVPQGARPPSSA
jgi:glucose-1-phosphate adenylyltransferase